MMQWYQRNWCVVTTNYVLSELIALFTRFRLQRSTVLNYIKTLRPVTWIEIARINEVLDAAGVAITLRQTRQGMETC